MSDAISKLYAEIGFKVNQDGLKEVKNLLTSFAEQMNSLNKATKEAAKQYGIFSKEKNKQALADEKLATQQARTEEIRTRSRIKVRSQEFKEEMALKKAESAAEAKREREKDRVARANERRREKESRENRKFLRGVASTVSETLGTALRTARNVALAMSRVLGIAINESLGRSISTRDFMLSTGASLGDIQSVMQRFANIGESVNQETVMGDLIKLSQSMASVAMGRDNADAYKLLGTSIRRGDIGGMLRGIGMASRDINPDMFTNIINSIGLPYYWNSFFRAQGSGRQLGNFITGEGNQQIIQARTALSDLTLSFKNLADWLTATLSPTIIEISESFIKWNEDMSTTVQGEYGTRLRNVLKRLAKDVQEFLGEMTPEKIYAAVTTFFGALNYLAQGIIRFANFLGFESKSQKIDRITKDKDEALENIKAGNRYFGGLWFTPKANVRPVSRPIPPMANNVNDSRNQTLNFFGYSADEAEQMARNGFDAMDGNAGTYNAAPAHAW